MPIRPLGEGPKNCWVARPRSGLNTFPGRISSTKITIDNKPEATYSMLLIISCAKPGAIWLNLNRSANGWINFQWKGGVVSKVMVCTTVPKGVDSAPMSCTALAMSFRSEDSSSSFEMRPSTRHPCVCNANNVLARTAFGADDAAMQARSALCRLATLDEDEEDIIIGRKGARFGSSIRID